MSDRGGQEVRAQERTAGLIRTFELVQRGAI